MIQPTPWLLLGLALVASAPAPRAPAAQVSVQRSGAVYVADGTITAACSLPVAWEVLTDYGHLARFTTAVQRSEPLRRDGPRLLLRQEGVNHVLGFAQPFHLLLDVYEEPSRQISFRNLDDRDFISYSGSWSVRPTAGGVEVQYHLRMRPRNDPPDFFVSPILHDNVNRALTELRAEMLRRAGAS